MRTSDPFSRPLPTAGTRRDLPRRHPAALLAVEANGCVPRFASLIPLAAEKTALSPATRQRLRRQSECSEKIDAHQAVFGRLRRLRQAMANFGQAARISCQG